MEKFDVIDEHLMKANHRIVIDTCKNLTLDDDDDLLKVKSTLLKEIKKGLSKRTNQSANVKCLPSYIQQLPRGCEKGRFLTIELDGLKVRILLIHLRGTDNGRIDVEQYEMPNSMLNADATTLFDYIAVAFSKFIYKYELEYEELNIGLLFGFPLRKISLSKAILIRWDKGFNCSGVVGYDVIELLRQAIQRISNFQINVIINVSDITSTLITGAWLEPTTKIGVIIDNNANACYVEQTKHIELFEDDIRSSRLMVINTHWANFGDNGALNFIRHCYDKFIDEISEKPREGIFEKMIAGKYLAEMARLLIIDCIFAGALFDGVITEQLNTSNCFTTAHLIDVINEEPARFHVAKYIFQPLGYKTVNQSDSFNIRYICTQVIYRAAKLLAAGTACLIDYIGDPYITIAWNGYICHTVPAFMDKMKETLNRLVRPEHKFKHIFVKDAALGGAIMAAIAADVKKKRNGKIERNSIFN